MQVKLVDYNFDNDESLFSKMLNMCPSRWMENKRYADNTEGLWRIHNGLYDFSNFINIHPGGKFWLEETKDMDVTELFESHHVVSDTPEKLLKRFYVREAKTPRLAKYTFDDNGFYRTVKRRVREALKIIPKNDKPQTHFYMDSLAIATIILASLASYSSMYTLAVIAGVSASFSAIASHNYSHMKENWRMYYMDLFWIPLRVFRIVHILSHHMFTNSSVDMQVSVAKPVANIFPVNKTFCIKYLSYIYVPLFFFPLFIYVAQIVRILEYLFIKSQKPDKSLLLTFVLPTVMCVVRKQSICSTLLILQVILVIEGLVFGIVAFTSNHIHPDIYVEGDITRSKDLDWGVNQLDTTQDRHIVTGNKFLVLVTFGDHALHHLFPTLDHSVLNELYPVVEETLNEFNYNSIRMTSQSDLLFGFFKRLNNEIPNLNPSKLGYISK